MKVGRYLALPGNRVCPWTVSGFAEGEHCLFSQHIHCWLACYNQLFTLLASMFSAYAFVLVGRKNKFKKQ